MGTVGLTASAGVAGWLEFLLLRHALQKRIGPVSFPISYQLRLWSAALAAGAGAAALDHYVIAGIARRLPFRHISEAAIAAGVFGIIYFVGTMLLRVPEARATLSRLQRR